MSYLTSGTGYGDPRPRAPRSPISDGSRSLKLEKHLWNPDGHVRAVGRVAGPNITISRMSPLGRHSSSAAKPAWGVRGRKHHHARSTPHPHAGGGWNHQLGCGWRDHNAWLGSLCRDKAGDWRGPSAWSHCMACMTSPLLTAPRAYRHLRPSS